MNRDQLDLNALPFINSSFFINETDINLDHDDENFNTKKWTVLKKKDLHFIHININSLLLKINELKDLQKIFIIAIDKTKLDDSISSNKIEIEVYDLARLYQSQIRCCLLC